jgi:hypothetical protein
MPLQVSAFLRNLQIALDGLQKQIDQSLNKLPETKRDDLPRFLAEQKRRFVHFHEEQLDEWRRFVEEAGLEVRASGGTLARILPSAQHSLVSNSSWQSTSACG